jgi:hypothetical protein
MNMVIWLQFIAFGEPPTLLAEIGSDVAAQCKAKFDALYWPDSLKMLGNGGQCWQKGRIEPQKSNNSVFQKLKPHRHNRDGGAGQQGCHKCVVRGGGMPNAS